MMNLRSKRFCRSISKLTGGIGGGGSHAKVAEKERPSCESISEIKWELRPGGMLVQKRDNSKGVREIISVRVSTVSQWHEISIEATSTFGELKMILSLVTGLEPSEQRILFKGKEREDDEYLHMVGVRDKDKVLVLEDPAIKERKLLGLARGQPIEPACRTISV